jgi:hypothetical protein
VFTRARHRSVSWATWIHSTPSNPVLQIHFNIILPSTPISSEWFVIHYYLIHFFVFQTLLHPLSSHSIINILQSWYSIGKYTFVYLKNKLWQTVKRESYLKWKCVIHFVGTLFGFHPVSREVFKFLVACWQHSKPPQISLRAHLSTGASYFADHSFRFHVVSSRFLFQYHMTFRSTEHSPFSTLSFLSYY